MSKELNFKDGNDVLKYQDSNSVLQLYLSEDGNPFDISRFDSLTLKFGNENGFLLQKPIDLSSVSNPTSGNVTIPLDEGIMTKLVPDDYSIELWGEVNPIIYNPDSNDVNITVSDIGLTNSQAIFPSDGNLSITVDDNIKASPFDSINAYPLDDIWQSLQKWESDTVSSLNTNITNGLQTEITQWQGDISEKLKKELLQDLANDEGTIKQELNNVLTTSLDALINKEVNDLKTSVSSDVHNDMVNDVANQIATIKPQITSDLHTNLTNELSTELSSVLQSQLSSWESSTDTDLNNKIAQSILDKTTTMQNNLNSEFTNYIASQLGTYESNASNTITANITSQVTQNIANEFNSEDSQVRADLENLVKGTIQNDVTNTLQQMQQNGDIYATKQQFTDFTNGINNLVSKLDIASNITDLANDMKIRLSDAEAKVSDFGNTIDNLEKSFKDFSDNALSYKGDISNSDIDDVVQTGLYTGKPSGFPINGDGNKTTIVLNNSGGTIQICFNNYNVYDGINPANGNIHITMIRMFNGGQGWQPWHKVLTDDDLSNISSEISSLQSNTSSLQTTLNSLQTNTLQYEGKISSFDATNKPGYYKYSDGTVSSTLIVYEFYDVLLQYRVDTWDANGLTFTADNDYAPKIRISADGGQSWQPWKTLATDDDVQVIKSNLSNLTSSFNTLQSNVANMDNQISSTASGIATNSANINNFASSASSVSASLTGNLSTTLNIVTNNSNNISTLQSEVATNSGNISSLQSSLASFPSNVSSLQSSVVANSNNIAGVDYAITTLQSSVSANSNSISTNSNNISNIQSSLNTATNQLQNNINNVQNSSLQFRGVWQGQYWDWGSHADGIYIIDRGQNTNPLDFFTNGGAGAFSGWGLLTLISVGGDKYGTLHDNVNHMFRNHLATGLATFSGWIQY